jgi:hypothetical protein
MQEVAKFVQTQLLFAEHPAEHPIVILLLSQWKDEDCPVGLQSAHMNKEYRPCIRVSQKYHWCIILSKIQESDFSVVLFRSDCRLFSEQNRMKVHINQWVLTVPYPLEHLAGATSRG